jgi:hypothetical protein
MNMQINVMEVVKDIDNKSLSRKKEVALYDKDLKQPVLDDKGNPLIVSIDTGKDLTFRDVFEQVLVVTDKEDDSNAKLMKWKLLNKIHNNDKVEISLEEAKLLNDTVQKLYQSTIIIGRVDELLNK